MLDENKIRCLIILYYYCSLLSFSNFTELTSNQINPNMVLLSMKLILIMISTNRLTKKLLQIVRVSKYGYQVNRVIGRQISIWEIW